MPTGEEAKKQDNPSTQNLGFAFMKGSSMDCKQFFEFKEKGELLKGIASPEQPADAYAVLRELEEEKQHVVFQKTTKAMISVTLMDKTVVTTTKDVRAVLTARGGPNCFLYFVQVDLKFK